MNKTENKSTPIFRKSMIDAIYRYRQLRIFILLIFMAGLFAAQVPAQNPVPIPFLEKIFTVGGTYYHNVNGGPVPYPGLKVIVTTTSVLNTPSKRIVLRTSTGIYTTDKNGHFEGAQLPCFKDTTGVYTPSSEATAKVEGAGPGIAGFSSGDSCENTANNAYINMLGGGTPEPHGANQENGGPTCAQSAVGHPVNVTNGNMWVAEHDYGLPGVGGDNIKIDRYYNSITQQGSIFGWGWKTDLDESVINVSGGEDILVMTGTGRGMYFMNIGNNVFQAASAGVNAQVVRNPDLTYDLTYDDGRIHHFRSDGKILWKKDVNGNQTTFTYDSNNYLTSVTDPFGKVLTLTLNGDGTVAQISDGVGPVASYEYYPGWILLKSVTYPDGSKYQFEYVSAAGNAYLATVKDAFNHILETHQYDSQGRVTTSEEQDGVNKYTLDYTHADDDNPYTTVTDGLNHVSTYYYDKSRGRNVITHTDGSCGCAGAGSESVTNSYDDHQNLIKTVDSYNREIDYTYNDKGQPLTVTNSLGTESLTYNALGELLTATDRMNGVMTNTYDTKGNLLTMTNPLNATTTMTYTPQGQLATITDARSKTTGFTYDTQGRLAAITDANNKSISYAYDARSRITAITNQINQTINLQYDLNNRIKKVIFPDTKFITYTYDTGGRRTGVTDERGNTTTYAYDNSNRLITVTDALNHTSQIGYDLMSNVIAEVDALGNITNFEYDNFNRPTKTTYPAESTGATRLFAANEYDLVGNLKKHTDTAGRATLYDYDAVNRLIKTTDPNLQYTQYEYNLRSQMTKVTDAANQQYVYTYDPLGHVLTKARAGSTEGYQYDAVGNLVTRTDYKGTVTNYTYDNLSRLQTISYPTAAEDISYTYDDLSRLATATNYAGTVSLGYDNRSRLASVTDVHGKVISYGYDETSNRTELKLDGVTQDTYVYDQANRLTGMTDDASGAYTFAYDAANKLTSKTLPNTVVSSYTYDGTSRLTRLKDTVGTNVLFDRQYSYNQASQISQIAEPSQTKTYNYDNLDRLTQVLNAATPLESYGYDAVGNRTGSHLSSTYSYLPFNRISGTQTATYVYDSNGNMVSKGDASGTTQYVWDYENRLRQVIKPGSQTASYEYDALGRRTKRIEGTNTTKFTYDGGDVLMDDDTNTGITRYQNLGTDNKLKLTNNGVSKYFIQDHLGSTNALTDASGTIMSSASYDSYGNSTNSLGTRYQYTGREKDDFSGLTYNRARWYSSELGKFISEDPLGFGGGDINTTGYVGNNPLSGTDPSGLSSNEDKYYEEMRWQAQEQLLEEFKGAIQFGYGFGDNVLMGLSKYLRPSIGVDECSVEYQAGEWVGFAIQMIEGGLGLYEAGAKFLARRAITTAAEEIPEIVSTLCCFEAGTPIHTEKGLISIEKIKVGDKVLSYNEKTEKLEYKKVASVFSGTKDNIVKLKIEGENQVFTTTNEHPFYIKKTRQARDTLSRNSDKKGEWKTAEFLKVGDKVLRQDGKWTEILEIKREHKPTKVYNFEVEDNHSYFVGENGVLSHNCDILLAGAKFKDHFIRHKALIEALTGNKYSKFLSHGAKFLSDVSQLINSGRLEYLGQGTIMKGGELLNVYRGEGVTVLTKTLANGATEFVTALESGSGMDLKIMGLDGKFF